MQKMSRTRILAECAVMIALATVLSFITIIKLPNGGSVTAASMVPIVFISLRHDLKWGLLTGFAYSLIQMIIGFYPPPTPSFLSFTLVILLDYVFAFTVLGAACLIAKPFGQRRMAGVVVSTAAVTFLRFVCSFFSGLLIWNVYAPEGQPAWLYSLTYNGSYMLPEIIITTVVTALLCHYIDVRTLGKAKKASPAER